LILKSTENEIRNHTSEILSDGWAELSKHTFELRRRDGSWDRQVREVYDRGNAAVILPYDPMRGTVLLVRQFRLPAFLQGDRAPLIEACAGLLDENDPETCIRKEAEEELGYRMGAVTHIYDIYMSPGSVTEKLSFFTAEYSPADRVSDGGGEVSEGEDIEVLEMPLDEALAMVKGGRIVDAKTVMLVQHLLLESIRTVEKNPPKRVSEGLNSRRIRRPDLRTGS
jgi:nudix-type nucleoside diphosphatase (YffH/AdpP family)